MAYEGWESSSNDASTDTYFNVWDIDSERQAHSEIATRLESIEKLYQECLEIAERFDICISYALKSDIARGHNQEPYLYWNPSSQNC